MQAQQMPARAGLFWIREGLRLFSKQPVAMLSLPMAYMWGLLLLMLVPIIGPLLPIILAPGLSVGLMAAGHAVQRGERPSPLMLIQAFRNPDLAKAQIRLGLVFTGWMTLAVLASVPVDGGEFARLVLLGPPAGVKEPIQVNPWAEGTTFVFTLPILAAFWFSPMLVAWHQLSVGKALFFSIVACWRNWLAFAVFGLGWLGLLFPLSYVLAFLAHFMGLDMRGIVMLALPVSLIMVAAIQLSHYVSYRSIFALDAVREDQSLSDPSAS